MVADFFLWGGGGVEERLRAARAFVNRGLGCWGGGVSKQGSGGGGDSRITANHGDSLVEGASGLRLAGCAQVQGAAAWRRCFQKNAR